MKANILKGDVRLRLIGSVLLAETLTLGIKNAYYQTQPKICIRVFLIKRFHEKWIHLCQADPRRASVS